MPHSDFLTRRQIADLYPIPYSTLKKFSMHGSVGGPPVIRIGKAVYYHVPSFEKWLLSYLGKAPESAPSTKTTTTRRGRPTKAEIVDRRRREALARDIAAPQS